MWEIKKLIKKGDYQYALVPDHPNATKNGYVLAHRVIMENHIGRLLDSNEVVHHKNENKLDNDISNLELMDKIEHNRKHGYMHGRLYALLKCPICGEIFEMEYHNTIFQKNPNDKTKAQCCSRSCGSKLGRLRQLNRITHKVEIAISENLLSVYRKFTEDNSEETLD